MTKLEERIIKILEGSRNGMGIRELRKKSGVSKAAGGKLEEALESLAAGSVLFCRNGRYFSAKGLGLESAEIVKVAGTFGFARLTKPGVSGMVEPGRDVFIPGRMLMGAMPGDIVLIKLRQGSGDSPEGEVAHIVSEADKPFSGIVVTEPDGLFVMPDDYLKYPIRLSHKAAPDLAGGEKILARIIRRGERHSEHVAQVVERFGSSDTARACCLAILAENGIKPAFPSDVLEQAREIGENGIHPKEIAARSDLRDKTIFTMDGEDTKDIDDAVSLEKTPSGWELGVHIADVSYYVPYKSPLDIEAYGRGTSVYFADSVVPMLPPELSNGICSLNPGEDRLALSAIIALDGAAHMTDFKFVKTVIRSRVQGVYSEINSILGGFAADAVREKYFGLTDMINDMAELAAILTQNRYARGGMDLDSPESKITVSPEGAAIDVKARERGLGERIIEEFMLVANEAAAALALKAGLPFVFRVHEPPAPERIENLYAALDALGVRHNKNGSADSGSLARILDEVKGSPLSPAVNSMLLRSMAKAKYSHENIGHYGLALRNYAHFTSPIRRYPDLTVHRVLSGYVTGMKRENIIKRYSAFVPGASAHSTGREIAAASAERSCEDCYKAEYMRSLIGESFDGVISSAAPFGIYVRLENTVEGLVRLQDFPTGDWSFDGLTTFSSSFPKGRMRIGDRVRVEITGANISAGQVDMRLYYSQL